MKLFSLEIDRLRSGSGRGARVAIAATLLLLSSQAWSASLGIADLPGRLAAELASGEVHARVTNGRIDSYLSHGGMSAYAFTRGGDPFTLVRYEAIFPTQWYVFGPVVLAGPVFVEAPLAAGADNRFVIDFDQLQPAFSGLFWDDSNQAKLLLTPQALEAGFGSYALPISLGGGDPEPTGTMDWDGDRFVVGPYICLECGFDAEFNLVYLDYSGGFLQFNLDDPRTLLFRGEDSFYTTPQSWALEVHVAAPDIDSDGVLNETDNCLLRDNPDQFDADGDGFGNACDADFNDDCFVNFDDLQELRVAFFGDDPEFDLDGSGDVGFPDLMLIRALFFQPPGPSGLPNACSP